MQYIIQSNFKVTIPIPKVDKKSNLDSILKKYMITH